MWCVFGLQGTFFFLHSKTSMSLCLLCIPHGISLGDDADPSNFLGFCGLATLLPHFCQLSVPEVGVCGVYPESP